jgi:hypothetical protein
MTRSRTPDTALQAFDGFFSVTISLVPIRSAPRSLPDRTMAMVRLARPPRMVWPNGDFPSTYRMRSNVSFAKQLRVICQQIVKREQDLSCGFVFLA